MSIVPEGDNRPYELHHPSELEQLRAEVERLRGELTDKSDLLDDYTNAHAKLTADLSAAEQTRARAEGLLRWVRGNCRVVHYFKDDRYPIEHAPDAGKDAWDLLVSLAAQPDAATDPEQPAP